MKNKKAFQLLLVITATVLSIGCSTEESSDDTKSDCNNISGDVLTGKLDGKDFCASITTVVNYQTGVPGLGLPGIHMVYGADTGKGTVTIVIFDQRGTYTSTDHPEMSVGGFIPISTSGEFGEIGYIADPEVEGSMTVEVTEVTSERIKGNFEFIGIEFNQVTGEYLDGSISFTNGYFDIPVEIEVTTDP